MKANHQGHRIVVEKARCNGGWELLYWSITRIADGALVANGHASTENTIPGQVQTCRDRIDEELSTDDPWNEKAMAEQAAA